MKIQFRGRFTVNQLRSAMNKHLDHIEDCGIEEVTGANFYFTPWANKEEVTLLSPDGEEIEGWVSKAPRPSKTVQEPSNVVPLKVVNGGD